MSCSSCNCSPCHCDEACDPNNEPLSSALDNFRAVFFGPLTKTCVNNAVTWVLPCDLTTGNPILPRNAGEGIACYLLRLYNNIESLSVSCLDFRDKIFLNGVCYSTWQAAYDANIATVEQSVMYVGEGSFGDLVLTANYNTDIYIVGMSEKSSILGNVVAGAFNFNTNIKNVSIGSITATASLVSVGAKITGQISMLAPTSILRDVVFTTTASNLNCIQDLSGDGAQFQNCLFVPHGTGFSINASVARTIIAYGMLHRNGLGPNVTLSEGNEQTSPNLLAP